MAKKNKKNKETEFVYEEPAEFAEEELAGQEQQTEEEIVYVDEEGNPIQVDENGNPIVAEEVVYVDEHGNHIEKDENGNPVTDAEEVVYVDEEGNPVPVDEDGNPLAKEEIVYVDEEGNPVPVDENGDPLVTQEIIYVDEDGNPIPVDENGNPILEEGTVLVDESGNEVKAEVTMETVDESKGEYKEDEIFVPYEDENQEPVIEPTPAPMPTMQPNPNMVHHDNNIVGIYGKPDHIDSMDPSREPRVQIRPVEGKPGLEEITYVEYERVLPEEVLNAERTLHPSTEPIDFLSRKAQNQSASLWQSGFKKEEDKEWEPFVPGSRESKKYVEYELDHPYSEPKNPLTDSKDYDENNKFYYSQGIGEGRQEFNKGMEEIRAKRKERELNSSEERERIYKESKTGQRIEPTSSTPLPTLQQTVATYPSKTEKCKCGCAYCCHTDKK